MTDTRIDDFILFGSTAEGGRFYICRPSRGRNVWLAYDVRSGGEILGPRVVFGAPAESSWRGLPAVA
jgi:hypothetical protein